MKYGLTEEESSNSKAKWRAVMEQEIMSLKFEVATLKEQLKSNKSTIEKMTDRHSADMKFFIPRDVEHKFNPFVISDNNNNVGKGDITFEVSAAFNDNNRIYLQTHVQPIIFSDQLKTTANISSKPIEQNCVSITARGTSQVPFKATTHVDFSCSPPTFQRFMCITPMTEYTHWSLEELRLQDYEKLKVNHSWHTNTDYGTLPVKYRPTVSSDVVFKNGSISSVIETCHHCITTLPQYADKSFEELRFEDYFYNMKRIIFLRQLNHKGFWKRRFERLQRVEKRKPFLNKKIEQRKVYNLNSVFHPKTSWPTSRNILPTQPPFIKVEDPFRKCFQRHDDDHSHVVPMMGIKRDDSKNQEQLLTQVLAQLGKMEGQLLSLNNRLVNVDWNLSSLNSQMSMMDSRLSGLDMFVSMQRLGQRWRDLESQLVRLESPSASTKPPVLENSKSTKIELSAEISLESNGMIQETKTITENSSVNIHNLKEKRSHSGTYGLLDTSMLRKETSEPPKQMDIVQSPQLVTLTLPVLKSEVNNPENENKESQSVNENNILTLIQMTPSTDDKIESIKTITTSQESSPLSSPSKNKEDLIQSQSDNLTSEVLMNESGTLVSNDTEIDMSKEPTESDVENEYEIIEKDELSVPFENMTNETSLLSECSSSGNQDFKMYNDITEYMEVNLGKKKGLVYEFGFEAKPDSLENISLVNTSSENISNHDIQENNSTDSLIKGDDSFISFMSNLIKNHHVKTNQSSPLLKVNEKAKDIQESENPPDYSGKPT